MMKILFVCKYNLFRSRIAEAYFNKLNRDKQIKTTSTGLIKINSRLPKKDTSYLIAKKFGFNLNGKPRKINNQLLKKQDIIVVVANDVSKSFFKNKKVNNKIVFWDIHEETKKDKKNIINIIRKIKNKVTKFYTSLQNGKKRTN